MTTFERAERYAAAFPPAISGSGGHNTTLELACALTHGFALGPGEALAIMERWNQGCQPPWEHKDLERKVQQALARNDHQKPRGHLLDAREPDRPAQNPRAYVWKGRTGPGAPNLPALPQASPAETGGQKPRATGPSQLNFRRPIEFQLDDSPPPPPNPLDDPTRRLLMAAFEPGEGVCIANAFLNDEGVSIPSGAGLTMPREWWLAELDKRNGDLSSMFSGGGGCFIRVNPMKEDGAGKDSDVTAFRHVLLEFDHGSLAQQWQLLEKVGLPATAILYSGGKSLHAWVRIDAKDAEEYRERVGVLYDYLHKFKPDGKNKNPSRFSRLPGILRGDRRQELLAVDTGRGTFLEWLTQKEVEGIGETWTADEVLGYNYKQDAGSVLLGNRWLCRGAGAVWGGPAGVGKSSLSMQAAVTFAMGRDFFGVRPHVPKGKTGLKSLIIQAENDLGDLHEMLTGVAQGLGLDGNFDDRDRAFREAVRENLVFVRDYTHAGQAFVEALRMLVEKHRPDLVWVDPLYTYIGDDISDQAVATQFLATWLGPILKTSGAGFIIIHHTAKPSKDLKSKREYDRNAFSSELQYDLAGSAVITNWPRAIVNLRQLTPRTFELVFSKRGKRAGAKTAEGKPSERVHIRHGDKGICWLPVTEEEFNSELSEETKRGVTQRASEANRKQKLASEARTKSLPDPLAFARGVKGMKASEVKEAIEAAAGCAEERARQIFLDDVERYLTKDKVTKRLNFDPKKAEAITAAEEANDSQEPPAANPQEAWNP